MAEDSFSRYLLLPELRLLETRALGRDGLGGTELLAGASEDELSTVREALALVEALVA